MSRNYWLSLGPITRDEERRAFKYLRKHNKPVNRRSDAFRNFVARLRKRRELNRFLRSKTDATTEPSAPWHILYGDVRTGGTITFAHTSGPADDPNKYLHLVITLACHEITRITQVYFDEYEVSWDTDLSTRPTGEINATGIFANLVKMQINYGADGQAALTVPVNDNTGNNPVSAKWTSNHRQRGHAHVYLRLTYNENIFKNGQPDISFRLLGNYNIIDPRTGSASGGASNAAMVLYDYMTNARYGMGLSTSTFNTDRLEQAVDDCEDAIELAGGGTENRYLINAVITADEAPGSVVEEMLASMAGRLVYSEGKWSIYAGKERTSVMTITEDMILSDVQIITKTPRIDSFNTVRGTFVANDRDHEECDFPEVTNSTYVSEDNSKKITEDLTFSMVTRASTCQRLAKIELESCRQGIYVEMTTTLAAYQAEPGEWVSVTFSRFGWSAKTFEVIRSALQIEESEQGTPALTVRLMLKETASSIFDWDTGDETTFDAAPNTNLPDPFAVADPSALTLASGTEHLYLRSDGTVFSRLYLSWTGAADTFVRNGGYYEIQFKRSSDSTWQDAGDVPGGSSNAYILDVEDSVSYDVRIRSVNALGARGSWVSTTGHTVVGKTEPPSNVSSLSASVSPSGVKLTWPAVADLDVREYEVRYSTSGGTWDLAAASNPVRVRATNYTYPTFQAGSWTFYVKAIDTSGNYSAGEASTTIAVSAPSAVRNLNVKTIDGTVLIDWEAPAQTIFPIQKYLVLRQESAVSIILIGATAATFATYVELIEGNYTYRVIPVDVAGNEGPSASVTKTVYAESGFALRDEASLDLSTATLSDAAYLPETLDIEASADTTEMWEDHFINNNVTTIQGLIDLGYNFWLEPSIGGTGTVPITTSGPSVWMPYAGGNTWEDHFVNNNVTTIQEFIDAGYPYWLQPSGATVDSWDEIFAAYGATTLQELYNAGFLSFGQEAIGGAPSASVTLDYDLGETLPQTVVSFDYQLISQGFIPTPRVYWRALTTDPWTAGPNGKTQVTPSDFRYLRLVITGTIETSADWAVISAPSVRISVREITDSGTANVLAADSGGTTVTFNKDFLDVSSITVSAQGTTGLRAVRDFNDVANPTSFKILLFDADGDRTDGVVSWHARGVQAVI